MYTPITSRSPGWTPEAGVTVTLVDPVLVVFVPDPTLVTAANP
jgi:hypothetical protein